MNRDDIIRMAREACWTGIYSEWSSPTERTSIEVPVTIEQIERFATLVAAAEREGMAINSIHSCHSECQRPICVLVREAVASERDACAKLCLEMEPFYGVMFANAIRERGAP